MLHNVTGRLRDLLSAVFAGWVCCALSGCGGGGNTAPTKVTPIPAAQPTRPVVINSQKPEPNAPGQAAKNPAAVAPKSGKSKTVDPFADVNPKYLFEIAESGPLYTLPPAGTAANVDLYVVGAGVPDSDSSQFTIEPSGETGAGDGTSRNSNPNASRNAGPELPEGFTAIASFGYSPEGLPWRIHGDKSGAMMALVPGGLAHVGSVDGPAETQPAFTPFLETFYMDVTEVTLGDFAKFRDDTKQKKNTRVQPPVNDGRDVDLPALGVPWGIAQGFAHWAGKELPTEAEFEKAARGPHGFRTPWGDGRAVWPKPRTPDLITPVAAFPTDQSVYGIFDLAGNAREWCSDWYADTAHQLASQAPERALLNWPGPKKASVSGQRVVKGNGPDWSAWHRAGRNMTDRPADVGFRCVLRIKLPKAKDESGD